jgi:MFS family permease
MDEKNKFDSNTFQSLNEEDNKLIKENVDEKQQDNDIDAIIDKEGYKFFTYKQLGLVFLLMSVGGMHMTAFSSMIIPFTNMFQIKDWLIKVLSSILFLGVGLGSFVLGRLTNNWTRTFTINLFMSILAIASVALSFCSNPILFGIVRFILGFCLGILTPVSLNLLTECLPIYLRAFILTSVWLGYFFGQIILEVIMLYVMPDLEIVHITATLLYSSIIPIFCFIMCFFFLEDSPRNLILRNKETEGIEILEKITGRKIDNLAKENIIKKIKEGVNKEFSSDFKEIFNSKYLCLTILLSIIWLYNSFILYGPGVVTTLTLKSLGVVKQHSNYTIILEMIKINLFCFPGCILSGLLCEVKFLGRKKSLILVFLLSLISLILLIIFPNFYSLFFGLTQAFVDMGFNITSVYSCEVYPTKIRDTALGFLFFSTHLGGTLSQFFYLFINDFGIWIPYYVTIAFVIVNLSLTISLPYETYDKNLDFEYENKKDESVIDKDNL